MAYKTRVSIPTAALKEAAQTSRSRRARQRGSGDSIMSVAETRRKNANQNVKINDE